MLISYSVYDAEIGQFINEIKQLKQVKYSVGKKAYKVEFNDDTYVYIPKENSLNEQLFVRDAVTDNGNILCIDDYYIVSGGRPALRNLDDITEAQLRLNDMSSKEYAEQPIYVGGNHNSVVVLSDKVFEDTVHYIKYTLEDKYELILDGYNGTDMVYSTVGLYDISDDLKEEVNKSEDKKLLINQELRENILNNIEF